MVGVLALQGNFASHIHILNQIGISSKLAVWLQNMKRETDLNLLASYVTLWKLS